MHVTRKNLPQSRIELQVTLPWEEWQASLDHAAKHLAEEVKMPGFRPGKAPRNVLEQRFGKPAILAEAAEHAISESYPKALESEGIDALGRPEVDLGALKEGEMLTYTVRTDVMPKADLKNWKKAVKAANAQAPAVEEVTDEAVDAEIRRIAEMRAPLVTVDRPASQGDTALVDFTVSQGGAVIEGGKSENHPIVLGSNSFIPGFEEAVVGMRAGEEKAFLLSFPEDYHAKHLAGNEAKFEVKLRAVQEKVVPELSDEFAKTLGAFETLAALRENVKKGMEEEAKVKAEEERRTRILDALVGSATIDYPRSLVEEELGRMMREFDSQVRMMGMDLKAYLAQTGKTEEALRTEWEPQAKKRLAAHLSLSAAADELEIVIDQSEIEAEMNKTLQYYKSTKDAEKNLDLARLYTAVKGQLINQRALEALEKI